MLRNQLIQSGRCVEIKGTCALESVRSGFAAAVEKLDAAILGKKSLALNYLTATDGGETALVTGKCTVTSTVTSVGVLE